MNFAAVPDLTTFSTQSRAIADADRALAVLAKEVATGLIADPVEATGGDPLMLYQIEREIEQAAANLAVLDQGRGRASATQLALGRIESAAAPLGADLLGAATLGDAVGAVTRAAGARGAMADMASALNARFAERSLFAGAAVDRAAVAPAEDMLAEIESRIAPGASSDQIIAIIDDYFFADPGGFAANGYLGADVDAPPLRVGDDPPVTYAVRADDDAIVATLAALAIIAIGGDGPIDGAERARTLALLREGAERAIEAGDGVAALRSQVGAAEARIEELAVRETARSDLLTDTRLSVVAADQFEAATELKAVETKIQAIFSVTARLSDLSLTNFLR